MMITFFFVSGKQCIIVESNAKIAEISETLCIGCGICVKVTLLSFIFFLLLVCFFYF